MNWVWWAPKSYIEWAPFAQSPVGRWHRPVYRSPAMYPPSCWSSYTEVTSTSFLASWSPTLQGSMNACTADTLEPQSPRGLLYRGGNHSAWKKGKGRKSWEHLSLFSFRAKSVAAASCETPYQSNLDAWTLKLNAEWRLWSHWLSLTLGFFTHEMELTYIHTHPQDLGED